MAIGVVGDWLYNWLGNATGKWGPIRDPRILDFIDGAEWISLWLLVSTIVISIFGLVAIYAERKVSAHMQSRLGPMRVGPKGLLQTLADGVKLLEKEDIIPKAADPVLFIAAPCFVFASAVAMFVVLPFFNYEGKDTVKLLDVSPSEVSFVAADADKPVGNEIEVRKEKARRANAELIRELSEDVEVAKAIESTGLTNAEGFVTGLRDSETLRVAARRGQPFAAEVEQHAKDREVRGLSQLCLSLDLLLASKRGSEADVRAAVVSSLPAGPEYEGLVASIAAGKLEPGAGLRAALDKRLAVVHKELELKGVAPSGEMALAGILYTNNLAPVADLTIPEYHVDRPWFGTPAWNSTGLFFLLAISSVSVMGVVLAGWGSNNKWALYGAIREAAQMVSYEIPMGIAALCVVVACQSLNLMDIAQSQETGVIFGLAPDFHGGIASWNIFKFPILLPVFVIWYIGVLAHTKRAPFDLPEAESELIAGFMTEYSGMRWSLFFLAEYGEMYALSALTAVLFMGGMSGVFPYVDEVFKNMGPVAWMIWGAINIIWKTLFLVFVMMWLRWTLPRIRLDQIMYLCLKVMLPFTMVALLLQTVWTLNPWIGLAGLVAAIAALLMYGKGNSAKRAPAAPTMKPTLVS